MFLRVASIVCCVASEQKKLIILKTQEKIWCFFKYLWWSFCKNLYFFIVWGSDGAYCCFPGLMQTKWWQVRWPSRSIWMPPAPTYCSRWTLTQREKGRARTTASLRGEWPLFLLIWDKCGNFNFSVVWLTITWCFFSIWKCMLTLLLAYVLVNTIWKKKDCLKLWKTYSLYFLFSALHIKRNA